MRHAHSRPTLRLPYEVFLTATNPAGTPRATRRPHVRRVRSLISRVIDPETMIPPARAQRTVRRCPSHTFATL